MIQCCLSENLQMLSPTTSNVSASGSDQEYPLELSVVMPCLNEAETIETCIRKVQSVIQECQISAEIIVADNGSTDGSIELATKLNARVVHVDKKGYGAALQGGIAEARGRFVIMGDADDSYDFLEIPKFLDSLREGFELVQGCRLPSGGGHIMPGAMPFLHRWWGNPTFSWMVRLMFRAPIHDVYCGLRGFTNELYRHLELRSTGMEFATEMVIKTSLFKRSIAEVPITLHPDGRQVRAPHLRTFRDGWRTLWFFLIYSPNWLFMIPGVFLIAGGLLGYALALPGIQIWGANLDAHTLLFASLAILLGHQAVSFAALAKTFGVRERLLPQDSATDRLERTINLERGVVLGGVSLCMGIVLMGIAVNQWRVANFGDLEYAQTMRIVIPGVMLSALGCQTIFASFFLALLRIPRR